MEINDEQIRNKIADKNKVQRVQNEQDRRLWLFTLRSNRTQRSSDRLSPLGSRATGKARRVPEIDSLEKFLRLRARVPP